MGLATIDSHRKSTPRFTRFLSLVLIRLVSTEIQPFENVKIYKDNPDAVRRQRPDCHTFLCKFDECELVQLCLRVCVSAFCIIYLTLKLYCALKYGCSFCFIFSPLWLYRAASWVLSLFSVIHALWLVNLAVRTLLYGPLKFEVFCC